jgi:hypothetical protein
MSPIINSLASDPGVTIGVILGSLGIVGITVMRVAKEWRKVRQAEEVTALKTALVERGMSAEEIIKVVEAKPQSEEF